MMSRKIMFVGLRIPPRGWRSSLESAIKEFFDKDRTTLLHWRNKSDDFIQIKDAMFIRYLNELL
jgi:hypothetical protein